MQVSETKNDLDRDLHDVWLESEKVARYYDILGIINDILIGLWFLVGSIFFLYSELVVVGTWLFIIGSIEMLIRPIINIIRRIHLDRIHSKLLKK